MSKVPESTLKTLTSSSFQLFAQASRPFTLPALVAQGCAVLYCGTSFWLTRLEPNAIFTKDSGSIRLGFESEIDEYLPNIDQAVAPSSATRAKGRDRACPKSQAPRIPGEAVREAVINAIVHADYSIGATHVQHALRAALLTDPMRHFA